MPGKRGGAERPRTRHARRKTREAREPGGRGGVAGGRSPGREARPRPPSRAAAGTPDRAHALGPRGSQRTAATARRAEEGEGEGGGAPSPSTPAPAPPHREPARPGGDSTTAKATPRTADARPRRPAVTPAPEGRGTPAGEDTATGPRWARPGTRPALGRAHRSGGPRRGGGGGRSRELPLVQHATAATDRRRRNGQRIGTAAGPEARHTRARPREAADGERTEADGQTERSTDGVRPREANATEQGRCWWGGRAPPRGAWLKATRAGAGGSASRPPGPTAGSHRRRPPSTGTVPPHARDDGLAPSPPGTLTGAHAHRHRHTPESRKPARENALPPRTGGPHVPHTRKAPRAPPRLGDATGRRRPGERHPHEARPARPQTGEGSAGRSHARDEEERPAAAGRGRQARTAGAAGQGRGRHPGTTKTPGTRPGHQENQRGVPPPPTHEGGPATRLGRRPVPASPRAGPHDPAPPPGPASRPNPSSATRPRQIRLPIQVCHPEARHPGDHALERGGPDRDRTPPPAAARGERAGAIGSPAPRLRGWGSRGRPDVAPPTPSPLCPKAHHTAGADRAHTRRTHAPVPPHLPDARRGPAGPSPNSKGGGAGRGRQRAAHGPTAGPAHPPPTAPRGEVRGGVFCPRALGSRHGGHCALRRGSSWGVRYPKAPSRIAREGFLTEGSPPLTRIVSLLRAHGGAPRATSPQLGWEGSAVQVGGAPTQERLRGRGQRRARVPSPARPRRPVSLDDEGNRHASPTASTPPQKSPLTGHTHTPPRWGPEEDTGVKGNDTTARPQAPERRPGALQGHHRGSNEARSRTRAGGRSAAAVQPSPPRGGPLAEHTPGRRSESICCVRRPTAPTDATRGGGQETEGQGQRPQPSPRLPPPPRRPGGKSQARGPADRPRRADTFPGNTCPSSGTA